MSINHFFLNILILVVFDLTKTIWSKYLSVQLNGNQQKKTAVDVNSAAQTKVCQQFVNNLFSTLGCLFDSCAHSRSITADNSTIKFDPTWLPHDACPKSPGKCVTFARRVSGQQHKIDSPCVRPTASSTKHSHFYLWHVINQYGSTAFIFICMTYQVQCLSWPQLNHLFVGRVRAVSPAWRPNWSGGAFVRIDPGALYGGRTTTTTGGQRRIAHTIVEKPPQYHLHAAGSSPNACPCTTLDWWRWLYGA